MRVLTLTLSFLALSLIGGFSAPPDKEASKRVKEASSNYAKEGFKIRQEFWSGTSEPGKRNVLKHQLFRGNEYWFWLGSDAGKTKFAVKIYDDKGRPVDVETKHGDGWAAARILPPRTGTYTVVFVSEKKEGVKEFAWAMTYGYR